MIDIVCAHGWLMGPDMWSDAIPDRGGEVRVHAIAQPGHGVPGPPPGFDMEQWADWLVEQAAARGVERAVFAGHSMGGFLVQQVARRHPQRVLGLVLVDTTDHEFDAGTRRDLVALADAVMLSWGGPITTDVTNLLLGRAFVEADPDWVRGWHERVADDYNLGAIATLTRTIADHPDMTAFTPEIRVPTLVVHGADDVAVPPALGAELAGRIPGARLVSVEGSGHCPPLERPAPVRDAIGQYLDSAVLGAAAR